MRSISIVTTAALSIASLLIIVSTRIADKVQPAAVDTSAFTDELPTTVGFDNPNWKEELAMSELVASTSESIATTSDPLSLLAGSVAQSLFGGYLSLKTHDAYTPERGERLARTVAENITAPALSEPYTLSTLTLDTETSPQRILAYRSDMREALAPLITDEEPEFALLAQYFATKDPAWLERITTAASRYRSAEELVLTVAIPHSAASAHLRALNALRQYAETLERIPPHADDAFAAAALIKALNEGEREMLIAFDLLAKYYVQSIAQQ